jgi:hypothetical protein
MDSLPAEFLGFGKKIKIGGVEVVHNNQEKYNGLTCTDAGRNKQTKHARTTHHMINAVAAVLESRTSKLMHARASEIAHDSAIY